jgi:hypothetical protein
MRIERDRGNEVERKRRQIRKKSVEETTLWDCPSRHTRSAPIHKNSGESPDEAAAKESVLSYNTAVQYDKNSYNIDHNGEPC